jgi:hypothetical protein
VNRTIFLSAAFLLLGVSAFAQQDPNDPGMQDSLIVGSATVDTSQRYVFIPVYAVVDDSVIFYSITLTWIVPDGDIRPGTGTQYFPPLTGWDAVYDTIVIDSSYIRFIAWADIGGGNNLPLIPDYERHNIFTLRFLIPSGTPPQRIIIDTMYTPYFATDSASFVPAFQPGYIDILPVVGVDDDEIGQPNSISLAQNYPNPFNPSTEIGFALNQEGAASLAIYDILGRNIRTLLDGRHAAGGYSITWDGKNEAGSDAPSGIYLYRLTAGSYSAAKRMTLVR